MCGRKREAWAHERSEGAGEGGVQGETGGGVDVVGVGVGKEAEEGGRGCHEEEEGQ